MDLSNFSNQLPTTGKPTRGLLVFLLMALPLVLPAQREWQWGQSFGGAFDSENVIDMEVDSEGNTYLIASTAMGLNLNDSIHDGYLYGDYLLASYDCDGNLRWYHIVGSSDPARSESGPQGIELGENKLYVIGKMKCSAAHPYHFVDSIFSEDEGYLFISRFQLDGKLIDIRRYNPGTSNQFLVLNAAKHNNKLVIAFGAAQGGSWGGVNIPNPGFYVITADTNGLLSDAWQYGNASPNIETRGIGIDDQGNVIIGGYGTGPIEIGGQSRSAGAFVAKFSPQGQLQWLEGSSGSAWTRIFDLVVRDGVVLCCGDGIRGDTIFGTVLPDPQNLGSAALVATMSVTGSDFRVLFPERITASCAATHCDLKNNNTLAVHLDLAGITVIGQDTFDMPGSSKPVVLLLDSFLNITEHIITNTQGLDYNTSGPIRLLDSNIFISGTFASTIYLGTTDTLYKQGGGDEDIFIAKYGVEQCVDTSTGTQLPTLPTGAFGLLAYPNPATTHLTVKWQSTTPGNHTVLLTDMQGRPVHREVVSGQSGTFKLSTASVATGLYYLHLQGADGRQAGQMVVVQR